MKTLILVLSFCLAVLTTSAVMAKQVAAISQDPLQERLDFLKRQLQRSLTHSPGGGEGQENGNTSFEPLGFETCKVAWRISTDMAHSTDTPSALSDIKLSNQVSVDLSSIDAARSKIYVVEEMRQRNVPGSLVLELKIRPGSPGFKVQMVMAKGGRVTRMPTREEKSYAFFFNTRGRAAAEDISKAFADASNTCRSTMQRPR
jgi:hypothetical protein